MRRIHGFTIVELLIVVVVIGILAAISIVAYSGVSQKANNAAIIDAAGKTQRLMQAYIATEGKYPLPGPTTMFACVTTETGCRSSTEDFPVNATTGYTNGTHGSSGKTECTIKVPGPPHAG